MAKAILKQAVISGLFRLGALKRRAIRADAPPEIARQYDRLDRLQHMDPFPPEGLGIRTRLRDCWRRLDLLAAGAHEASALDAAVAAIDAVEDAIVMWRAPTLMRTGRHGVSSPDASAP